ncbi:glutathione hydrolase 1 proenzyme-like [Lycorma delicatula]|uniref:glutathione hydrolase 1 proenzyme-like n=1 Tax=Lycorma delicatula TaxID=130591 RepID=UPI003F5180A5
MYARQKVLLREWFIQPGTDEIKPAGTLIRPERLCDTLQITAEKGGDELYNGTLAKTFIEDIQDMGGIITLEDLQRYKPKWRELTRTTLHGEQTVYAAPPPGSGVLLAFFKKNIIDGYKMDAFSVSNINSTILTTHRMVEAFKYAFVRRTELGDPDFVNITSFVNELTSKEYADYIRKQIRDDRTYGAVFYNQEDHGTAHISVISPDGDAVSVTSTINLYFGAGITSKRTGIILNSGMDDFSVPGNVNYFGLQPSPNNFIEPGKMPLSSVSLTIIVDKDGNVTIVIGASGGTKITTAAASLAKALKDLPIKVQTASRKDRSTVLLNVVSVLKHPG